ncbi:N-acetylmuramoyl-L-alanine amidase [compost metagenome]
MQWVSTCRGYRLHTNNWVIRLSQELLAAISYHLIMPKLITGIEYYAFTSNEYIPFFQGIAYTLVYCIMLCFFKQRKCLFFLKIAFIWIGSICFYGPASAQDVKIIDKPVIYDSTRIKLSLQYLKDRHNLIQTDVKINPKMVVLHWTASKTFSSAFNTFNRSTLEADRSDIARSGNLNVSSQFLIDRDGTIYRLMPEDYFARHVIGLNYCAIGIENVGSSNFPLTEEQLHANEQLIRYLHKKYAIEYLIGHYEYNLFRNTALWKETDSTYQTSKTDPGADFMEKIRANVLDLKFKGAPEKK